MAEPLRCTVCGGTGFRSSQVLWPALIDEWQISPEETAYIDRQQGETCTRCGANLRSIVLADALRAAFGIETLLADFCASPAAASLKVLELNEAGTLHPTLRQMPGHVFGPYPHVDMHALPYADGSFDVVVHSDTLEHIPNPIHALSECRRVLGLGGTLCYTVPIIVGRLTRDRTGLPRSYHGAADLSRDDYLVQTEFGADAWTYPIRAGFTGVRIFSHAYPAALAISARREA